MAPILYYILYFLENRTTIGYLLSGNESFYSVYLLLSQLISLSLIGLMFVNWNKYKHHGIFISLCLYSVCLVFCNLFAGGVFGIAVGLAYPPIAMMSLLIIISNNPQKIKKYISLLAYTYFIIMLIHFLDSMSTMDPERNKYIFQTESFVSFVMFIGLLYVGLDYYINMNKRLFKVYVIMFVLSTFFVFTATALLAAVCFMILLTIPFLRKRFEKKSLFKNYNIVISLFLLFATAGLFLLEQPALINFSTQVLGKTPDLSGRAPIWPQVILGIMNSPIYGNGFSMDENKFFVILEGRGYWYSAHNQVLQTLYNSGVVGFLAFSICVLNFSNILNSLKNKKITSFLQILFFSVLLNCMGESPQMIYLIEIMTVGSIICQFDDFSMQKTKSTCNPNI